MTRRITITIKNLTNNKWVLNNDSSKTFLKHGKWMKNSPPKSVSHNSEVVLKSEKQTGASYGTTGQATYQNDLDPSCEMVIKWNKPYGSDDTTCEAWVTCDEFKASVKNKDFQKSEAFCDVVLEKATPSYSTKNWMGGNWGLIKDKVLSKICIPGSHDSGIYKLTYHTEFSDSHNTVTQYYSIGKQVNQGIREFDVRPALSEGNFWTAHYSKIKVVGYQGGFGESLFDALSKIRSFFEIEENKNELIILNFSHFINWDDRDSNPDLTQAQKDDLLELITQQIGDYLVKAKATNLTKLTISELIKLGNVIPVFPSGFGLSNEDSEKGFWKRTYLPTKGEYSDTNDLEDMILSQKDKLRDSARVSDANFLFNLCWELTLSTSETVLPGKSILDYAEEANAELFNTISTWIANDVINKEVYPNVLRTNACSEGATKAVELSLDLIRKINS
ncbi:MAG: hypothetical protein HRT58_22555 [Crocinitomicaceae bacterium]|nr:hypothetical protein [Flavobacteriales bacterium]NQZ38460.1 hypothetical protein [Crocinitomicaceae bacterium]